MQTADSPKPEVIRHMFNESGAFPNSGLFLLIYKNVLAFNTNDPAAQTEKIFAGNNWTNSWRNGIFDYHHFHSNTHEVLGIYSGNAEVQFGGPSGVIEKVQRGDVVIIPAGLAHKCIASSVEFKCVGAYPDGRQYDIKKGDPAEKDQAIRTINEVPLPDTDPVFGLEGPMILNWEMQ